MEGGDDHDDEIDQELWAGGSEDRQRISDLPPEEAAKEIRFVLDV